MTGLVGRVAATVSRRPFSRFESAFYETAGAAAVADQLLPGFLACIGDAAEVLDVGCGGGVLAARLAASGRMVAGADPSAAQVERARRVGVDAEQAGAESLPFDDASFDAVVSSCSIKHWSDRAEGLAECLRVVRPGGVVVVAEVDGAASRAQLRAFAALTRIPSALRPLYPTFAHLSMVSHAPTAAELAAALSDAGAVDVDSEQHPHQPFAIAWGRRPATTAS